MIFSLFFEILLIALLFAHKKIPCILGCRGCGVAAGAVVLRLQHFAQALGVIVQRSGARFFAWPA